jgi:UrcA family protein
MNRKLVALIATGLAFVGTAAHAGTDMVTREVKVNFADLNLESQAGIDSLYSRLQAAARRVCGTADRADLRSNEDVARCRKAAIGEAVARIDNKALSARHSNRADARYAQNDSAART